MPQSSLFTYVKLEGSKLSPEYFSGREPTIAEVLRKLSSGEVTISTQPYVSVRLADGAHWLSERTYTYAGRILGTSSYEAREGVTFTASKGAWLVVGEPRPVEPPVGAPKTERYVLVETQLSRELGLGQFVVEERFLFRGFKGEDVEVGRVTRYRYFLAAYKENGTPLEEGELRNTLLWRNYLGKDEVIKALGGVSRFLKEELWHLERMGEHAVRKYKVVWRDVADRFVPAAEFTGAVPDYTVNYVTVDSPEEAYYLLAVLLAPQVNAVVEELSPWVGHVQPRFIKYFKIPKYSPSKDVHKQLATIGKSVHSTGKVAEEDLKKIEELVERL